MSAPSYARFVALALIGAAMLAGCAPGAAPPSSGDARAAHPAGASRPLVIALRLEPIYLSSKALLSAGATLGTTLRLFNAGLAYEDERDTYHPYLAEALPQLNTDTWRVFPDGRMETTYRLKSNLTWHDGTALSAEDWVFSLRVYLTPDFGTAGSLPQNQIADIQATDARTMVISWKRPYPDADALTSGRLPALPRHILAEPLQRGPADAFVANPYWSREYVGLGPFRLNAWEPGAFIEAEAFDGHSIGRPRIDRVRIIFVPDPNTALANLLGDGAHVAIDDTTRFQQAAILEREWAKNNAGVVLKRSTGARRTEVQMHPERVNPRALLDVRVRRAIAHAIDRDALNEGLVDGQGLPANTLIQPHVAYFPDVDRVITKYPYDPRQTDQLVGEVGYARGPDGTYSSPTAGRFAMELRTLEGGQNEAELAIMADGLRRAGFDMTSFILPAGQIQDGQIRASFPALSSTTGGNIETLNSNAIPRPENRWQGNNRSSWSNADYDRLIDVYQTTLARSERSQYLVQAARIYSEEIPSIPLYYNVQVVPHVAALSGPIPGTPWNVHLWEFR